MSYSLVEMCSKELEKNNESFDKIRYMSLSLRGGHKIVVDTKEIPRNIKDYRMDAYNIQEKHCKACLFYTLDYIYFTSVHDGFYTISSVPRNHDDLDKWTVVTYGGGSGATSE